MHPDYLGEKPQTRDLSGHLESLAHWVSQRMSSRGPARLTRFEATAPSANGFAGESFVMEVTVELDDGGRRTERYLLKREPTKHCFFPERDFAAEFRAQEALTKCGRVPVAPVGGYESDPSVLGAPFYLLSFIEGRPLPDRPSYYHEGWLVERSPEDQRAICISGLEALAKLHSLTLQSAGTEFLHRAIGPARQLDWDLAHWDRFCAIAWIGKPDARVTEARSWLEQNKSSGEDLCISWGDARPGNMLFDGTRCAAIIDWDMATCGDAEKDLGYWLAMDLQFQRVAEQLGGRSRLTGWPSRSEMVDIYERFATKPVDRRKLRYHRIFAAYQIACMYARYVSMRTDLDDAGKAAFINEQAPPIALVAEELEAASLPGCRN
jgi:aminoglycoside phosphotransferase (APT) family kinase protein